MSSFTSPLTLWGTFLSLQVGDEGLLEWLSFYLMRWGDHNASNLNSQPGSQAYWITSYMNYGAQKFYKLAYSSGWISSSQT